MDCFCGLLIGLAAGFQMFQYPLFRIVDCFLPVELPPQNRNVQVSISALSDRGLLRHVADDLRDGVERFNIRSFGSWIASEDGF